MNALISSPFLYYIKKYKTYFAFGLIALIFTDLSDVLAPYILGKLLDKFLAFKGFGDLMPLFLLFALTSLVNAIARYAWRLGFSYFHQSTALDLKLKCFEAYFKKDLVEFNQKSTGDKMSVFNKDVEYFRIGIGPGLLILIDGILYLTLIPYAMWQINSEWTKIFLIFVPVIPVIMALIERYLNKLFDRQQHLLSELSSMAQESIEGIKVIKSFRMERLRDHLYDKENLKLYKNSKRLEFVHSAFSPLFDFFINISCASLLIFVAYSEDMSMVQAGSLFAFYQYLRKMTWPLSALGFSYMMITEARSAFKRIRTVLENSEVETIEPIKNNHLVELKNVSFSYPDESLHLKDLNLNLLKGESYLITGLTKSGKSTLLKLFSGLQRPTQGETRIKNEEALYNPQTPFLFMTSLKDNIIQNSESKLVSSDFERVAFSEEFEGLENKEDTLIGEKGANLSGGQKQRLSLLRAIKSNKKAFILDEPISAVDESTKNYIVESLKELSKDKTLIISSSNPEHFTWMDNVILIEEKGSNLRKVSVLKMNEALNEPLFVDLLYKKRETKKRD